MSMPSPRRRDQNVRLNIVRTRDERLAEIIAELGPLVGGDPTKSDTAYDPAEHYPEIPVGRGLTIQIQWITPEVASDFISRLNSDLQRNPKTLHLDSLERDVMDDLYRLNGETIIFDRNDRMIDGSHRCLTVLKTNKPILTLVVRKIDPDAYHTINSGVVRSPADALKSMTSVNRKTLAGALRHAWCWENRVLGYAYHKVSPMSIRVTFLNHVGLVDSVSASAHAGRVAGSSAAAAFVHYVASKIDREKAELFFHQLGTGEGIYADDPAYALRKRYAGNAMRTIDSLALMIRAWNLVYTDQTAKKFQVTTVAGKPGKLTTRTIKFPKFIDDPLAQIDDVEIGEDEEGEDE